MQRFQRKKFTSAFFEALKNLHRSGANIEKKYPSFTNIAFIVVLGLKQLAFPPFLYFWVPREFQKASLDTIRVTVVWGSFLNRKQGAEISFREIGNHHWAVKAYYSLQCRNKMSLLCLTGGVEGVWEGGRFCETDLRVWTNHWKWGRGYLLLWHSAAF